MSETVIALSNVQKSYGKHQVLDGVNMNVNKGDIYVLLCAVAFAFHILAVDHFVERVDGVRLSSMQFLVCGILSGVMMLLTETPTVGGLMGAAIPIAYAGIMSCGVAYTLQVLGQKETEPTIASMILCLESVFALLAGMILLGEMMSIREIIGCVIMFAAIVVANLPSSAVLK